MDDDKNIENTTQQRDGTASAIGTAYAGPIGGLIGQYLSEQFAASLGEQVGDQLGDQVQEQTGGGQQQGESGGGEGGQQQGGEEEQQGEKSKSGGGCSSGTSGVGEFQASDGQCHENPKTPLFKLQIEENNLPENWWDKLPDFDPRVYDAIAMEQAAACVKYIFDGLPDIHELEHRMEARKNPKTCPRLKTQVPRTKIIKPKEVKCEVKIDKFIKKDQTY